MSIKCDDDDDTFTWKVYGFDLNGLFLRDKRVQVVNFGVNANHNLNSDVNAWLPHKHLIHRHTHAF